MDQPEKSDVEVNSNEDSISDLEPTEKLKPDEYNEYTEDDVFTSELRKLHPTKNDPERKIRKRLR